MKMLPVDTSETYCLVATHKIIDTKQQALLMDEKGWEYTRTRGVCDAFYILLGTFFDQLVEIYLTASDDVNIPTDPMELVNLGILVDGQQIGGIELPYFLILQDIVTAYTLVDGFKRFGAEPTNLKGKADD